MKKLIVLIMAFTLCFCCIACSCASNNDCKVTFVQDGKEVATFSVSKGQALSSLQGVPEPTQPTDTYFVSEWNYDKDFVVNGDLTINAITYTDGLTFHSYYSSLASIQGYEVAKGFEGDAPHILIPDSYKGLPVIRIAEKAFDGSVERNYTIKKVTLPKNLIEIGALAFNTCRGLCDIEIPSTVLSIGNNAFYEVSMTGTLRLSGQLGVVAKESFFATQINKVYFGEGITEIQEQSFCTGYTLEVVVLPKSIEKIDATAFWQQPVEKFFYAGSEVDWLFVDIESSTAPANEVEADNLANYLEKGETGVVRATPNRDADGNRILTTVYPKLYFYSDVEPTEDGLFWHFVNGEPAIW